MTRFSKADVFHRVPARLGEGPCWHAQRQSLWWIDILGQRLYEADLTGAAPRMLACAQLVGAIAPTTSGGLIAALHQGIYSINPDTGAAELFAEVPGHDSQLLRFNDAKVDPLGRFWAGTLALGGGREQAKLYRIDANRTVHVMRDRVSVSNGLAWSCDARTLYYIDSPTRVVQAFVFDLENGTLGASRVAITLEESDGLPDGCCMDVEGMLWVAHWGGGKVTRWDPAVGRLLATVALPVANVTSCAFGGPRRDQLFITTAVNEKGAVLEPEAGFLFRVDPGTSGPELASFAG